ncbi:MAG: hypothetical protein KF794_05020 [Xanthobacteraceae bacterium]|nr:hypothetical protein [Xanthobacteraceae bacterium]QYK46056.1 MAG: hypothetical protein KF794_05020 [Xanthobacteraceae bacterium]HMN52008.1 hypothetical protein [Xanthobacteraceae bacterium]
MVAGILQNTPYWVWAVLVVLLVFGFLQSRDRTMAAAQVAVLPAIMIPLSLLAIVLSFGASTVALVAWLAGHVAAVVFNRTVLRTPRGVRYLAGEQKFSVPGSWLPLLLMMVIFAARFVNGVLRAVQPAFAASTVFAAGLSAILGFCSGMFLSRAVVTLAAKRNASA